MRRPLSIRPGEGASSRRIVRWLAVAAAGVLFAAAFGLGMVIKSSSGPQSATSLASPVSIQAPRVSVPGLQRDVSIPALKSPPAPVSRRTGQTSNSPAPTTPAVSSTGPSSPPSPSPTPPPPPARVIGGHSGGVGQSSGGGGSVVHGGN